MYNKLIELKAFHWKCNAIVEGLIEGAAWEETKEHLIKFVLKWDYGDKDFWIKQALECGYCTRCKGSGQVEFSDEALMVRCVICDGAGIE